MKNLITSIFILSSLLVNGQNFKFDLLTKYLIQKDDNSRENAVYSNSNDSSYFLRIQKINEVNTATVYDLKTFTIHEYKIFEKKLNKEEIQFEFIYLNSTPIKYHHDFYTPEFEFETITSDSLTKTIKMNSFKNKKRKKITGSTELKVRKHSGNLFPLFRFSCFHPMEFRKDLSYPENVIVESAIGTAVNGNKTVYTLSLYEEVNFEIERQPNMK